MRKILVGKIYHHFKGNDYKVVFIGKNSETMEDVVIYQSLTDGNI